MRGPLGLRGGCGVGLRRRGRISEVKVAAGVGVRLWLHVGVYKGGGFKSHLLIRFGFSG